MEPDAEPDALKIHIAFFDVDRDGEITRSEIHQALLELGFSRLTAAVLAPVLALGLPSNTEVLQGTRHDDTGAFDKDGAFDEAAFERWFRDTDRDGSGDLSRWELLVGSAKLAGGPVSLVASVGEFQLVHSLLAEDGGLSREAVLGFLNGDLFRRLIAARTDPS